MLLALLLFTAVARAAPPAPLRILVPNSVYGLTAERELIELTSHYPKPVQLIRRGENFSSLRELVARYLAGDSPELAVIEAAEFPAIESSKMTSELPADLVSQYGGQYGAGQRRLLPFQKQIPALFVDTEALARLRIAPNAIPKDWPAFVTLVANMGKSLSDAPEKYAFGLPLQGAFGLWMFEAMSGEALWVRMAGGLKSDRDLEPAFVALQKIIDQPLDARPEETLERAVQGFVDRKIPLMAGSTDLIPYLEGQATFPWTAVPLPGLRHAAVTPSGNVLVATRSSPAISDFLHYLYAPEQAKKWVLAAGAAPLSPQWWKDAAWVARAKTHPGYEALARLAGAGKAAPVRSTDADVMRARSEWIRALHLLFGAKANRVPAETVFTQLDSGLTAR